MRLDLEILKQEGYKFRVIILYFRFFTGIRLLNGMHANTDNIVRGFGYKKNVIDIYSNSWGPPDSGSSLTGPGRRQSNALEDGAKYVRTN